MARSVNGVRQGYGREHLAVRINCPYKRPDALNRICEPQSGGVVPSPDDLERSARTNIKRQLDYHYSALRRNVTFVLLALRAAERIKPLCGVL